MTRETVIDANLDTADGQGGGQINFRRVRIPEISSHEIGLRHYFKTLEDGDTLLNLFRPKMLTWLTEVLFLSRESEAETTRIPKLYGFGYRSPTGGIHIHPYEAKTLVADLSETVSNMVNDTGLLSDPISAVGIVPLGKRGTRVFPNKFYEPDFMIQKKPITYLTGLSSAISLLQRGFAHGFWQIDTKMNAPFLIDDMGNLSMVDTGGYRPMQQSDASNMMKRVYEQALDTIVASRIRKLTDASPAARGRIAGDFVPIKHSAIDKIKEYSLPIVSVADFSNWLTDAHLPNLLGNKSKGSETKRLIERLQRWSGYTTDRLTSKHFDDIQADITRVRKENAPHFEAPLR